MAQDITLMGASYSAVPAVLLPKTGGGTARFDDTSDADAVAADIAQNKTAYVNGVKVVGTASGGGTASGLTKIAETSYQVSTTSTGSATVETWATGHNELWTSDKLVYVRIRDTAGKRAGYFYGSDQFFYNTIPVNGGTATSITAALRIYTNYNNGVFTSSALTGSTGYGVWADTLYSDGRVRIRRRYNSNYSLTLDGTYKVEVYLLSGVSLFE